MDYWYVAQLFINNRHCQWVFYHSEFPGYVKGDTIIKKYANGFVIKLKISRCFGAEKPVHLMEMPADMNAYPRVVSDILPF